MATTDTSGSPAQARKPEPTPEPSFSWRRARLLYLRIVALGVLGYGIMGWAYVIDAVNFGGPGFMDLRIPARNAIAAYAAIDLVAAVGLWLASAWGVVLWIVNTAIRVLLHTVHSDVHGGNAILTGIEILLVLGYVGLAVMAWREERAEEILSRQRRRQTMQTI